MFQSDISKKYTDKINCLDIKEFIIIIMLGLFLTDIAILIDIPGLREILTFFYLTIIPGLLLLLTFKLNKLEFLKKFVLSVGLSLSIVMFMGLILNSFYPFILEPLSLIPLIISYNLLIIVLSLLTYSRNKEDFDINDIFNFEIDTKGKLISPMILSVIFPFMAIFGTYFMNTMQNNFILVAMLILIPIYILILVSLNDRIPNSTYPLAIWMVSLSIMLMHGLTSSYLTGRDVHIEYYCFQLTLNNHHWAFSNFVNTFNACLSVTIMPTIYKVFTSLSGEYVFKLVFALIGSIIPVIIYLISRKYLNYRYALLATFLFISQMFFIEILGASKQVFSFVFFALSLFVLFNLDMRKYTTKIIFGILMFSIVLSHYTTAFISFIMIIPILLIPFLKNLYEKKIKLINFDVIGILGIVSFLWYIIVAKSQLETATMVIARASGSMTGGAVGTTRESTVLAIFGIGLETIPATISAIVNDAVFLTIGIGLISVLLGYKLSGFKKFKDKIESRFILGGIISTGLLLLFIAIPTISNDYGASRLFLQCLVFLAPIFVIGGMKIARMIKMPKLDVFILAILLMSLFICSTHLQYDFYGIQASPYYNEDGLHRGETFIYNQDLSGVSFLHNYEEKDFKIYLDAASPIRIISKYNVAVFKRVSYLPPKQLEKGQYIYLSYVNTNKNRIYNAVSPSYSVNNTTDFKEVFYGRNIVYDNGGSKIWEY